MQLHQAVIHQQHSAGVMEAWCDPQLDLLECAGQPAATADNLQDRPSGPEAFDISPGQGTLQPKQQVELDFCFYALEFTNAAAVAFCEVEHGPTYELAISAATGNIRQAPG